MKHLTPKMKAMILESLYAKYDKINSKLQRDFAKSYYEKEDLVDMKLELRYIEMLIDQIKEEN